MKGAKAITDKHLNYVKKRHDKMILKFIIYALLFSFFPFIIGSFIDVTKVNFLVFIQFVALFYEVIGSIFLSKGLFKNPKQIASETYAYIGYNRPLADSMIDDVFNIMMGLGLLMAGFGGQLLVLLESII